MTEATPALPPMAPVPISVALHVQRIYLSFLGRSKKGTILPSVPSTELFNDACKVTQAYINGTLVAVDPSENPCKDVAKDVQLLPRGTVGGAPMPQPGFSPGNPQPKRDMWGNTGGDRKLHPSPEWMERFAPSIGLSKFDEGWWELITPRHRLTVTDCGMISLHGAGCVTMLVHNDATIEQLRAFVLAIKLMDDGPDPRISAAAG